MQRKGNRGIPVTVYLILEPRNAMPNFLPERARATSVVFVCGLIGGARRLGLEFRLVTHATTRETNLFEAVLIQLRNGV